MPSAEITSVVRLALLELTEAQRETLYLFFFEGYSLLRSAENEMRVWETHATTSIEAWPHSGLSRLMFRQTTFRVLQVSRLWALPNTSTRGKWGSAEVSCAEFF
jgi:hypothetical protein